MKATKKKKASARAQQQSQNGFQLINLSKLRPNANQPRSDWSSEKRAEAVKRLGAAKVKEEAALALWRELAEAED